MSRTNSNKKTSFTQYLTVFSKDNEELHTIQT